MVRYLNVHKSAYSHWSKHAGENLPSEMHFFVTFKFFFSKITRLCLFIIDTFLFLYIIRQNDPASKSQYTLYNPMVSPQPKLPSSCPKLPSVKLPSPVIWDKFAYRRLVANLSGIIVQKREQIRVCRFGARCTMPPCFSVVNLREIGGRKEAQPGKNFSKRVAASAPSWRR